MYTLKEYVTIHLLSVSVYLSMGSCNTLNDLGNKVCIPNKTEYLNLIVFNMITGRNQSKALPKHVSYKCKGKFDDRKCNSNQK